MFVRGKIYLTKDGEIGEQDITPELDYIAIRPKMDFGTRQRMATEMLQIAGGGSRLIGLGGYQLALIKHNILSWGGPSFAGMACTPDAIEMLDMDEPLVQQAIEAIARRNPLGGASSDEKKAFMSGGASSSMASSPAAEHDVTRDITPST